MKIAVGGFQHETNTFAPMKADWAAFEQADSWPAMQIGTPLLHACEGMNIPIAGFVEVASSLGHVFAPLSWCSATPSGFVTAEAYDRFSALLLSQLVEVSEEIDAVYLDLHGAMVAEHLEDGEGALLRNVRKIVGPHVWVIASLDLHANVTAEMVAAADYLTAFRTYPHVDMAKTGGRAATALQKLSLQTERSAKAFRKLDFLIPLTGSCTLEDPAATVYRAVAECDKEQGLLGASFVTGFAPADIRDCGPSVLVYGDSQKGVDEKANVLANLISGCEKDFAGNLWRAEDAVARAGEKRKDPRPIILADTQDNPGAGGNGDTVGLLRALVQADVGKAVLGVLYDPDAARAAHEAGAGAVVPLSLGAHTGGAPSETPLNALFTVLAVSDGGFTAKGPYYDGVRISLGPTALIEISGVQVVVASKKVQCADRAMFEHIGCDLEQMNVIAVKSSVHFRADFGALASEILVVASPGPNPADHRELEYRRLRSGVRLMAGKEQMSR